MNDSFKRDGNIVDMHMHVPQPSSFLDYLANGKPSLFFRLLTKKFQQQYGGLTEELLEAHNRLTAQTLDQSVVDFAVALALDSPYTEDGSTPTGFHGLTCSNNYLHNFCQSSEKLLFGASVHPYRTDAIEELERLIAAGACLIKWLPSAQNIDPTHPKCEKFYDILRREKIPLLSHTGPEHVLKGFPQTLNDPRRLIPALERGVTVIAAHCGTRLMLHERSYCKNWQTMARRYENFYGDVSALVTTTRVGILSALAGDESLSRKLVYGSDFPSAPGLWSCLHQFGTSKVRELSRESNTLSRTVFACKALGVTDEVFARGGRLLHLPVEAVSA